MKITLEIVIFIIINKRCGDEGPIYILGLKPYLLILIRPRRSTRLDRPQNGGSHTEKVEEYISRRLSFLDKGNVGQASTWAT